MIRELRHTSATANFPYVVETVPFILLSPTPTFAVTIAEKLVALELAEQFAYRVLSAWPGKHRQDVFEVDDLRLARAKLQEGR